MKFFTKDNHAQLTRRQLLKAGGMLMVGSVAGGHLLMAQTAPEAAAKGAFPIPSAKLVDSFIAIGADGSVTAYNGHVDLGTGVRTALGQLVADELYVDFAAVTMVLGHTARTPDLGPTIASNTIQVSSLPMRHAAAQVRQLLIKLASENPVFPLTASPPRKALSSPAASATAMASWFRARICRSRSTTRSSCASPASSTSANRCSAWTSPTRCWAR